MCSFNFVAPPPPAPLPPPPAQAPAPVPPTTVKKPSPAPAIAAAEARLPEPSKALPPRPVVKTVGHQKTKDKDYGSDTRIVEKPTAPDVPQDNKENPFLAEADR